MKKDEIKNLIKNLIEKIHGSVNNISVKEEGSNTCFSIELNESHFFISNNGEALQALNHLVRRMAENKIYSNIEQNTDNFEFFIDINDFQKKKIDSLKTTAHMMAERARYFKSNVEIDPMSSFERRIVHEFLSNASDVRTESIGFGPSRRVVIKYIGQI